MLAEKELTMSKEPAAVNTEPEAAGKANACLEERIDEELRQFLKAVDEYQTASAEVAAACKSGCFDIARARKAMSAQGSTSSISQLQYPAQISARVRLHVDTESPDVLKASEPRPKSSECEAQASVDPIKWFGILVPQHLRNSQRTFSRGLEVCDFRFHVCIILHRGGLA